ncbi:MAG: 16S rRNA (guanine(966)-N(2))-methyltransferase RsmD [Pseudomonadota bacterium]|jgi:16S rRNA (guanine966-N2)-methyltransferase
MARSGPRAAAAGNVRIIGGRWRGRRLRFPQRSGLRPTGDRLRETLFNWLQPHWAGANCLDLFAGSGALGFEAASRGARRATLIERDPEAVRALRENCTALQAGAEIEIIGADSLAWLAEPRDWDPYDVAFVDPPFAAEQLAATLQLLEASRRLAAGAWIYVETARDRPLPAVPAAWVRHRELVAGNVRCLLFRRI